MDECIKMKLDMEVGLSPSHIVLVLLDKGPSYSPPQKKGHIRPPNSDPCLCGQTAGWSKMPLGTELGLSPGDIVKWDPAPPKRA